MSRLAACIDRGLDLVRPEQGAIRDHVETIHEVAATLDPCGTKSARRRSDFDTILARLDGDDDPIHEHMAGLMRSFRPGLFVGGNKVRDVQDNLDLERWFRLPKGHERRAHGRRHAGVLVVQEGPSLLLALYADRNRSEPLTAREVLPCRHAQEPVDQIQAIMRRKVMRKARSPKHGQSSSMS